MRAKTVPLLVDSITINRAYHVWLPDGKCLRNVEVIGCIEQEDEAFSFAGYHGLVVFKKTDGKRIYVKKPAIRCIEEPTDCA